MTSIENNHPKKKPPLELRLRVLSAVDYAPGNSIQARIKNVAARTFTDQQTNCDYQFTWRTISTWLYRFKKRGITTLDNKTRADKNTYRKIKLNELAEALNEIIPTLSKNKTGIIPKLTLYRQLLKKNYFQRSQLSQTSFYRMVRENDLLNFEQTQKLRLSFAMQFANELWQADTMYGPSIKQADGSFRKTFLIAFIDDASRVITFIGIIPRTWWMLFEPRCLNEANLNDSTLTMVPTIPQKKFYRPVSGSILNSPMHR